MRADIDGRVRPERRILRQRLALEHVERGALERAGIERGEDVGLDLQAAASGVDEDRAAERAALPELGEERRVEDPARGFGQRQQHDEHVGAREQALRARPRRRSRRCRAATFGRRAPAGDLEAERLELRRGVLAQHAEAEHADLDVAGLGLLVVVRPDALALLALVAAQLAQMDERVHDDPLAHPVA